MKKFRKHLWMAAGLGILAVIVSGIIPYPAIAQIGIVKMKASVVKEVDRSERIFVSFGFVAPYLSYTVPAGKVLVIEWVSAGAVPAGGQYRLSVSGDASNTVASSSHQWSAYFSPVPGTTTIYQQTRLYAKAGQTVEVAIVNGAASTLFMQGYLIDDSLAAPGGNVVN